MRGIAGLVSFDQSPLAPEKLATLGGAMAVDPALQVRNWCDGTVGFVHLLRGFLPEDRHEAQPLRSRDGNVVLVTDAALTNRIELAADLGISRDHLPRVPNSALVMLAYQKWGEESPRHLDGRYACAIWNAAGRRLFCAVDHFSIRPFYYLWRPDAFAFASTLRGLLSLPGVSHTLDDGVLADFLCGTRSGAGRTLYREIQVVPAAHRLMVDARGCRLERYWSPDPHRELGLKSPDDHLAAFRGEFERAVAAGLSIEGDIGIRLSGGLDSAATAAVAGRILADRGGRLQAIHLLPPGTDPRRARLREHDESHYVRLIQQRAPHIDFHFLPPPPAREISLEKWDADFAQHRVPFRGFTFAEAADGGSPSPEKLDIRRLLSGLGGNYVVSLECQPSAYLAQLAVQLRWSRLRRELLGARRVYGHSIRQLVRHRILTAFWPHRDPPGDARNLLHYLNPDFIRRAHLRHRIAVPRFWRWDRCDFSVRASMARTMRELMPQSVGCARSVLIPGTIADGYSPFFNRRLNEFCLALPLDQQINDGWDRLLLRRAMRGLLPDEVVWRTTRGFPVPALWTRTAVLRRKLPEAFAEMEQSALLQHYLDLPRLKRELLGQDAGTGRPLEPKAIRDLFSVGWFLRWLERTGGAVR